MSVDTTAWTQGLLERRAARMPYQPASIEEIDGPYVYFMVSGRHVKIGTTINLSRRLYDIKTGTRGTKESPIAPDCVDASAAILAAAFVGGAHIERGLHWKHAGDRIKGEWFSLTPRILEDIDAARIEQAKLEVEATRAEYEHARLSFPHLPDFAEDIAFKESYDRLAARLEPGYCADSEEFDRGYIY